MTDGASGGRIPKALVAAGVLLLAVAVLILLSWFGVGPFGTLGVFILTNAAGFFALVVLGVLGGAFVGMLIAYRMFSHQQFTPFERTMMESVNELRATVNALRDEQKELLKRVNDATDASRKRD